MKMNILGIDVGTSGVKIALFTTTGEILASSYREYVEYHSQPGYAELDAQDIWETIKEAIQEVTLHSEAGHIGAISISSMGEAVVPVSANRRILGPSILHYDVRGEEFLEQLAESIDETDLYHQNGNTLGNHFTLTKLMWIKKYQPDLYKKTFKFMHWSGFIAFMLGADATVDYSLANRTLLFDLEREDWSDLFINIVGLDKEKLPTNGSIWNSDWDSLTPDWRGIESPYRRSNREWGP